MTNEQRIKQIVQEAMGDLGMSAASFSLEVTDTAEGECWVEVTDWRTASEPQHRRITIVHGPGFEKALLGNVRRGLIKIRDSR